LAAGVLPKKLPTPCMNLSHLSLTINFDDLKEISAALCLIRSSPDLRKIRNICEYSFCLAWFCFSFWLLLLVALARRVFVFM